MAEAPLNATSINPLDVFALDEDDKHYVETEQEEFYKDLDGCVDHS